MVLVDTSVWIEAFRTGTRWRLEDVVDFDEVVTCPPVVQEILQGIRDERAFSAARVALLSLPMVESPMPAAAFVQAAELFRSARRAGVTVRSSVDCLIATCALRHRLVVLHRDRDFEALARVCPLEVRSVR